MNLRSLVQMFALVLLAFSAALRKRSGAASISEHNRAEPSEMPYIPQENAETLRNVASRLREAGISTNTLFREIYGQKKPPIGRSTFDRFVDKKTRCKNVKELGRIWDYLVEHYLAYFHANDEDNKPLSMSAEAAAQLLPTALAAFFNKGHKMPVLQKALAGEYVMWRRDLEPRRVIRDGIRVSKLFMTPEGSGIRVLEVQDGETMKDISTYTQRDDGYVFSHKDYVYWLTKEEEETCVKLAVITLTIPLIGVDPAKMQSNPKSGMRLEMMQGYVAAFSRTARYPRARIFCRPRKLLGDVKYGIIRVDEITDHRAKERILEDFTAEERAGYATPTVDAQ